MEPLLGNFTLVFQVPSQYRFGLKFKVCVWGEWVFGNRDNGVLFEGHALLAQDFALCFGNCFVSVSGELWGSRLLWSVATLASECGCLNTGGTSVDGPVWTVYPETLPSQENMFQMNWQMCVMEPTGSSFWPIPEMHSRHYFSCVQTKSTAFCFVCFSYFVLIFWNGISLCSSGWHRTHRDQQVSLPLGACIQGVLYYTWVHCFFLMMLLSLATILCSLLLW